MPRTRSRLVPIALVAAAAGLGLGQTSARASFTVQLNTTSASGADTQFNYTASLAGGDNITTGDYFKIYDFAGLVGLPSAPAGWTATVDSFSPPPNLILTHGDDPGIPNLTFTYTGSAPITGPTVLVGFSALSTDSAAGGVKDFIGVLTANDGSHITSFGDVKVPSITLGGGAPAPEPSSLISGGVGLVGAAFLFYRRRARASA